jgi:large subunit ribosomal protein L27
MAHKKAGGSTSLGRDSESKRLGVKIFGGQEAQAGDVIVRQRGSRYRAGLGAKQGGDDTIYATKNGVVEFLHKKVKRFTGRLQETTVIKVV